MPENVDEEAVAFAAVSHAEEDLPHIRRRRFYREGRRTSLMFAVVVLYARGKDPPSRHVCHFCHPPLICHRFYREGRRNSLMSFCMPEGRILLPVTFATPLSFATVSIERGGFFSPSRLPLPSRLSPFL